MPTQYKIGAAILAVLALFAGGFYTGKGQREVVTKTDVQERVVYKEAEAKTVFKDRIVTVIKEVRPDGTVTEVTKTEDKDLTQNIKTTDLVQEKHLATSEVSKPKTSDYSLGILALGNWGKDILAKPAIGGAIGRRLLGEVWVKAAVIPAVTSVTLGLETQF